MFVVASDGGLLGEPVQLNELIMYAGERYEIMVDARDGKVFDLVTRPVPQMAMNLPPFDSELKLVTIRPDGAESKGRLPETLATLPPLVRDLPPTSQRLVVGMRLDDAGMGALKNAGLMQMNMSEKIDPEVVRAVNTAITDSPALPLEQQLSANTINGAPFKMGVIPFAASINKDLRWAISEGSDRMLHPIHIHGCQFRILTLDGKAPPAHMAGWKDTVPVEKGSECEDSDPLRAPSIGSSAIHGALPHSRARGFRHDDQLHGVMSGPG